MSGDEVIPGFQKQVFMDPERLCHLEEVYKELLTENSLLTKAVRLAAEQAAILMSNEFPPGMKKALVKSLAREKRQWTKAV